MKTLNGTKKNVVVVGTAGLILAAVLAGGAVLAEKEDVKINVNTNPTAQPVAEIEALDPVREMLRMQREFDRFFGHPFAAFGGASRRDSLWDNDFARPDMDLRELSDAYVAQMDLPGMDKSGITVEVKDNILTVRAERKQEITRKDGEKVLMQERSSGFMSRAVMLSKTVDVAKVSAEYKDGVLKVTLPKLQKDQPPKQIEIN